MKTFLEFSLIVFIISCNKTPQWIREIENNNYKIVKLGQYPYTTMQIKYNSKEYTNTIKEIEKFHSVLNKIVYNFYPEEKEKLNFKYKYAGIHEDRIILRYFSRFPNPSIYAGYSLQFVIEDGVITEIYLYKTPLEK